MTGIRFIGLMGALLTMSAQGTEWTTQPTGEVSVDPTAPFFKSIDELVQPNWLRFLEVRTSSATKRERIAFLLGAASTDAHVAVEAQDGQAVKNAFRELAALAGKLNAGKASLQRCKSVDDLADAGSWDGLRVEIQATTADVEAVFFSQQDPELAALRDAGAWFRQLEVATAILASSTPLTSRLPKLDGRIASSLLLRLKDLPEPMEKSSFIHALRSALSSEALSAPSDTEWDAVSIRSAVAPVMAAAREDGSEPPRG
jgi:hypothetical protein